MATSRECSVSPILSTRPVTTADSLLAAPLLKSLNFRDDDPELTTNRFEPIGIHSMGKIVLTSELGALKIHCSGNT